MDKIRTTPETIADNIGDVFDTDDLDTMTRDEILSHLRDAAVRVLVHHDTLTGPYAPEFGHLYGARNGMCNEIDALQRLWSYAMVHRLYERDYIDGKTDRIAGEARA